MQTFFEWLENNYLNDAFFEHYGKHTRELKKLLEEAEWKDLEGIVGKFDSWEERTKENRVTIDHPEVGKIAITVSRASKIEPKKLLKTIMRDYQIKVKEIKRLQSRRAV